MEQLVQKSLEIACIGIWKVNLKDNSVTWDDIVYQIHEIDPSKKIVLDQAINFYHPDYRELVTKHIQKGIKEQIPWNFEAVLVTANGNERQVKSFGFPIIENGVTVGLEGSFIDQTEQQKAKAELENVFNNIVDLVCLHDENGTLVKVTPSAESMTGYRAKELIGKKIEDFVHPEDKSVSFCSELNNKKSKSKRKKIVYRFCHKNGNYHWFSSDVEQVFDENHNLVKIISSTKDITANKEAQRKILELNQELEEKIKARTKELEATNFALNQQLNVLNKATIVINTDLKGNSTKSNSKFLSVSGLRKSEVAKGELNVFKDLNFLGTDVKKVQRTLKAGRTWSGEISGQIKKKKQFWLSSHIFPITDANGKIEEYACISSGITKIKEHELEISSKNHQLADKNQELKYLNTELETFSYSVSHDLKAPLRAIEGFSQNVLNKYNDLLDETGKRWLKYIVDNASQMNVLITDILAYSRLGRHEVKKIKLDPTKDIEYLIHSYEKQYDIKVQYDIDPLPEIYVDRTVYMIIWQNLIENAIKYSSKKRTCKLKINHIENDSFHEFSIADNGVGFDMKYYDKLFGIFQRLHNDSEYEGTGVGLANVKRSVDKHGGKVWAEGVEGEGATFYFSIPKNN